MTEEFKKQITPPSTAEVFLFLLDISHPDWAQPYHVINDIVGHTINGVYYEPYGFEFVAPASTNNLVSSISLDDVDRRFTAALRGIVSPPTVTISLVSDRDFTVVEADGPWEFLMNNIQITGTIVTGELSKDSILNNKLSGHYVSSENFPGLFS